MGVDSLAGYRVALHISDPWEFVSQCGPGPVEAVVESVSSDGAVLLRLDAPIVFAGRTVERLVATVRHLGASFQDSYYTLVPANITPVAASSGPAAFEEATAWRGWMLLGAVVRV